VKIGRFRKILLCLVFAAGSLHGLKMRPEEIEELMRTMNEPKLVRVVAEEDDRGDDPPTEDSPTD
jgi:hypothetical protein